MTAPKEQRESGGSSNPNQGHTNADQQTHRARCFQHAQNPFSSMSTCCALYCRARHGLTTMAKRPIVVQVLYARPEKLVLAKQDADDRQGGPNDGRPYDHWSEPIAD